MWNRLTLCVFLSGCGFRSQPAAGDASGSNGPGSDASSGDASGSDAGGATDCLQHWIDGGSSLVLSTPQEIITTPANTDDRDPWISADGRRLYFARNPGSHGGNDIYFASRPSVDQAFANPSPVDGPNTQDSEERPSLTSDETSLIFSDNHNTLGGKFQLFVSKRNDTVQPFPSPSSPDQVLVVGVNINNNDYFDPFLTRDGLTLYLAPSLGGAPQQISVVTRTGTDQNFGASTSVPVINSGSGDANPSVSRDDRIIVFSSRRPAGGGLGGANLWYATRQSAATNFSAPQLIPTVNGNMEDADPTLSADGCELYFASTRNGGKYHLLHASATR